MEALLAGLNPAVVVGLFLFLVGLVLLLLGFGFNVAVPNIQITQSGDQAPETSDAPDEPEPAAPPRPAALPKHPGLRWVGGAVMLFGGLAVCWGVMNPVGSAAEASGPSILVQDTEEHIAAEDQLALKRLLAVAPSKPVPVGAEVTVEFSLQNLAEEPLRLEYAFVGIRSPSGKHKDECCFDEGHVLVSDGTLDVRARVTLDTEGVWKLWPCYALMPEGAVDDEEQTYCPDEWQAFHVEVGL